MTISDAKISGEEWDRLVQNVEEFETLFTSVFQGQILCAAFVFQFQPMD
jgi:cobalamin biosynthesis Co2+ chelatase CbiK